MDWRCRGVSVEGRLSFFRVDFGVEGFSVDDVCGFGPTLRADEAVERAYDGGISISANR